MTLESGQFPRGGTTMDENNNPGGESSNEDEPIPLMQRILDNHFLLLFLGVAVPAVFYIIWGVMEIIQIPIAP